MKVSLQETKDVHETRTAILAILGIIWLSAVLCMIGYIFYLTYNDGTAQRKLEIDSLDTCYKISLYIQDDQMTESYFSGTAGDKFVQDCIEPIFHKKYVDSNEVLIYLRNASCDDVNKWILDRYPYQESAEFEYKYRCISGMVDGMEGT